MGCIERIFFAVCATSLLACVPAAADAAADVAATVPSAGIGRPDAGGPTKVMVSIWVIDIDSINSAGQSYVANVFVSLRWQDARLAYDGDGPRMYPLTAIWNPGVSVANEIGIVRATMPNIAEVWPDGSVIHRQRFVGVYSQPMALHDFPLDEHTFRFQLVAPPYTPDEIRFVPDDRWKTGSAQRTAQGAGIADNISLPDWQILWTVAGPMAYEALPGQRTAGYALDFRAKRDAGYYLWKAMLPLMLIVLMSWLVFWLDPGNAAVQIGIATTAMLTLIAYRFAIDQAVPRVAYLTRMDYFVIGSSVLVFLALCAVVAVTHIVRAKRMPLAQRITRWARVVFIAAVAVLAAGSLWF
jgi:hypothetical protein